MECFLVLLHLLDFQGLGDYRCLDAKHEGLASYSVRNNTVQYAMVLHNMATQKGRIQLNRIEKQPNIESKTTKSNCVDKSRTQDNRMGVAVFSYANLTRVKRTR